MTALKYTTFLIAALFAAGVLSEEPSHDECSEETLLKCSYSLPVQDVRFAANKQELDRICPDLPAGHRCIDNFTKRCLPPDKRSHFNMLYSGTSMALQEICQEGPFQDEYLRHAPCMVDVQRNHEGCVVEYQQKLRTLNLTMEAGGKICCSLQEYLSCSSNLVLKTCGKETGKYAKGFLNRMSRAILDEHCRDYKHGSEACQQYNRSSHHASHWLALVAASILLSASLP